MASGGTALLAGTGIKPKANTAMALWGIMSPEGPCCFQERFALFFRAHDEDEDCLEDGYDTWTIQALLGHNDVSTTMIYIYVLNRGWGGVRSPADRLLVP